MADSSVAKDLGTLLAANGFGTVGVDLFEGLMPDDATTATAVYETHGRRPIRVSTKKVAAEQPTAMIRVRNPDYETGYALAQSMRKFLQDWSGTVNGMVYLNITAVGTVNALGRVESGQFEFSVNFYLMRVPG